MKSISLTSRHDFDSLLGVLHLGEADLVDLEVLIYFLQCSFCHEVDFVDLEARVYFPCYGCPSFGVVDFVDFEVLIYFLQCSS